MAGSAQGGPVELGEGGGGQLLGVGRQALLVQQVGGFLLLPPELQGQLHGLQLADVPAHELLRAGVVSMETGLGVELGFSDPQRMAALSVRHLAGRYH